MQYMEAIVFGNHHTGRPLCSNPMIQNIILPKIGLPQENIKQNLVAKVLPHVQGKKIED